MRETLIFLSALSILQVAYSNERHFTYLYESGVLGKGNKEFELHTTMRMGKDIAYYSALDNRMEFEVGVSKRLQTAFYINFGNVSQDDGTGLKSVFLFRGISSEWKYQFSDPATSKLGFALYGELSLNTDMAELETKLILDKKIKRSRLALNLTFEPEWGLSSSKAINKIEFEGTFGYSYSFSHELSAGFELRNHNEYSEDKIWEYSSMFGGPMISYSASSFWATFTVLPQIYAFKGRADGSNLNFSDHEKLETRLIFSFRL